ncbi:MAG: hypothetical protein ABFE13_09235 [Phycisphaerales bacterium]
MRRAIAFAAVAVLSLSIRAGGASGLTTRPVFSYEKEAYLHVARQLQEKRVVALADFAHGNAYPYHTLMQVLSNWPDVAAPTGGQLVLAMEMDAESAEILREYLRTGDIEPVLEYWLPFSSLDQLAFYGDLREFALRVQRVNDRLAEDRKIGFRVLGLETLGMWALSSMDAPDLPGPSQAAEVANERDRRVAAALMAYLKEHPQDKVLLFYGMDHLCIRETRKSWAGRLFGSAQSWQPMGYLVKQELADSFLSIAQNPLPPAAANPAGPSRDLAGHDIFMKSSDIPWKLTRVEPADYDAVIFPSSPGIDEAHLLRYMCSRRILEHAIAKLARIGTLTQNAFTAMYRAPSNTVEGLRFITGQSFENASQWRQWAAQNPYDGFARMDSSEFGEAIRRECCQPMNRQRSAMLASLGLPAAYYGRQKQISPEQWRDAWPKLSPRVRFLQCLGVYWVGYPQEKQKAREYLIQFSGQDLESPAMYLKWYRKACLGLTY